MFQPSAQDVEDLFDCEFRDPSGTRCIGTVRLRIGLEGATIENQNGILGKFAFTRILSWSTTDDKCFTFTVKTVQKTKQDITVWGPPQLIQAISDSVDAKVARLMVLKKEGYDINDLRSPPNPAAGAPLMPAQQQIQPQPQSQGSRPFRKLSKLFSPKSRQQNMPPAQGGFFPPGMPQGMPLQGMPPQGMLGSPAPGPQGYHQMGGFTPQQQNQQQAGMYGAMQQQQQQQAPPPAAPVAPSPAPQPAPQPAPTPQPRPSPAPAPRLAPVPENVPRAAPIPAAAAPSPSPADGYDFSPDAERADLQRTLSQTREYAHKMKEALMQRDTEVIEATKKAEEATTREEATSTKVRELEEQLRSQVGKYEELRRDVESIKRGGAAADSGAALGAVVPYGDDGSAGDLYQTYREEAEALRKANSMLREQNHHLRSEGAGGEAGGGRHGGRRLLHKKARMHGDPDEIRQLRARLSELEGENSRLHQKVGDQERLLQDYEATVAQTMPGNSGGMFLGGGYDVPYSKPADPMQQLKSLMGEAYLVKMALKKKANPGNEYVIESLDNWIMASHKLKKVCTF